MHSSQSSNFEFVQKAQILATIPVRYHLYSFCLPTYLLPTYLPTYLQTCIPASLHIRRHACIPTYLQPRTRTYLQLQERTIIQSSDGSRKDKLKKGEESFSVDEYSLFKQDNKFLGFES